ncbi:MAG TPA: hypothetical protein VI485_21375 [Vicinamibacterales bacterium]|nr:hypothetical protein [Vicinamibacterales bacterium]
MSIDDSFEATSPPGSESGDDGLGSFATEDVTAVPAEDMDAFATEGVMVIDTADDTAQLVEAVGVPLMPVVRSPRAVPVPRTPPPVEDRTPRAASTLMWTLAATVVLLLSVYGLRLTWQSSSPVPVPAPAGDVATVAPRTAPPVDQTAPAAEPRVQAARPAVAPPIPAPQTRATVDRPIARPGVTNPPARATTAPSAPSPTRVAPAQPVAPSSVDARIERAPDVAPAEEARVAPTPRETELSAAPPAVVSPVLTDRAAIDRVLHTYEDSYDRLDAPSAAAIWPRVDTRALSRAFSTLAQQDMSFDRCDVNILGARATARCTGAIRYVRRVGDQDPRVRQLSWSFALERISDRWQIASVTAE